MELIDNLNAWFSNYAPLLEGTVATIGILGGVGGAILSVITKISSRKLKKKVNEAEQREAKLEEQLNTLTVNNSQMAQTINNYGLSLNEIKQIVNELTDKKLENVPNFYYDQEPHEIKKGDIVISGDMSLDFGDEDRNTN